MRSVLLPLLVPLIATALRADEIAVDLSRSPFCLIGQSVNLTVAAHLSMVEGQFEFKYVPRFDRIPPSATVAFEFPLFVPDGIDDLKALVEVTQIKLRIGGAEFEPDECGPLPGPNGGSLAMVPENIKVMVVTFQLPRSLLRDRATIKVSYFQPHYQIAGKEVSAYLPLLPDFEALKNELLFSRTDFTVDFEALETVRLHRLSANQAVIQDTPGGVKLHPAHREIIAVEVVPSAGNGQTAKAGPERP